MSAHVLFMELGQKLPEPVPGEENLVQDVWSKVWLTAELLHGHWRVL